MFLQELGDCEQCGTCNERGARSSPRSNRRASPIKEKRLGRFSSHDFLRANPSSAENLRAVSDKRKTAWRFSTHDFLRANPSSVRSRYIRAALTTVFLLRKNTQPFCNISTRRPCRVLHEMKIPAQDLCASPIKVHPKSSVNHYQDFPYNPYTEF